MCREDAERRMKPPTFIQKPVFAGFFCGWIFSRRPFSVYPGYISGHAERLHGRAERMRGRRELLPASIEVLLVNIDR